MVVRIVLLSCLFFFSSLTATSPHKLSLRLQWSDQFQFAGYYLAKEKGFYKNVGLEVTLKPYEEEISIVDDVISQKSDFGIGRSSLLVDKSEQKDILLLSAILQTSPHIWLAKKRPDLQTISDLKHKRIMIEPQAQRSVKFQAMLNANNISTDEVTLLPHTYDINDLINGKVDLISSYLSNETYELKKRGIDYLIFDPKDYGFDFYSDILFTSKAFASKYPKITQKFIAATLKGWEYAFNHIEESAKLIEKKYNPQNKTLDSLIFEGKALKKLAYYKNASLGEISFQKLSNIYYVYKSMGKLHSDFCLKNILFNPKRLTFSKDEQRYLKTKNSINMCVDPQWMPFEEIDSQGNHIGIFADYIAHMQSRINTKIKLVPTKTWSESLEFFKEGKCEILSGLNKTPDRSRFIDFTLPYFSTKAVIVINSDTKDKIETLKDVEGKTLGIVKDYFYEEIIRKRYPYIKIRHVKSLNDAVMQVSDKKIFATIASLPLITYQINKYAITNIKIVAHTEPSNIFRVGIKKGDTYLQSIFNKIISTITENEQLEIQKKWMHVSLIKPQNSSPLLTDKEKKYLQEKKEIRYCIHPDFLPIETLTYDKKHKGITQNYLALLEEKLPLSFKFIPTVSWAESIEKIKKHQCDILPASPIETNNRYLTFTENYIRFPEVLVTRHDTLYIGSLEELKEKKIALLRNSQTLPKLKKAFPSLQFIEVESVQEGLDLVSRDRLYGYIGRLSDVAYHIKEQGLHEQIKISLSLPFSRGLAMGIRSDEPILKEILSKAVSSISESEHQQILSKWFAVKTVKAKDYTLLLQIGAFLLFLIAVLIYKHRLLKKYNDELKKISRTDKLTGLYNRLYTDNVLITQKEEYQRHKKEFSVILCDIDDFKSYNDTYGHQTGDQILEKIATILTKHSRKSDVVGRWGGEEFLIIAPDTTLQEAVNIAKHILQALNEETVSEEKEVTMSFGVAEYHPDQTIEKLISRADDKLYQAKKEGKNRVCF